MSATWTSLIVRLAGRAVLNPRLAVDLLRAAWAFRRRDWWKRRALPAAAGPDLPALAHVHRVRRRERGAAAGRRRPLRAVAPGDDGSVSQPPHVVILGGGFAGLYAARRLSDAPVRVTLVDRRNHHLFQPMLYQVATAALNPARHRRPHPLGAPEAEERRGAAGRGTASRCRRPAGAAADGASLAYDYLIVATGAQHSYFGHDEWEPMAPGLKSLGDALEIRRRVLLAFERAERETDPVRRHAFLTFVIVGGGPTGVEMAGAVAEIRRYALRRDFRHIDSREATVHAAGRRAPPAALLPARARATRPSPSCGSSESRCAPRRW